MRWGSIVLGAAGLAVFEAVVSRRVASQNVGGFMAGAGRFVARFLSPAVPAFTTSPTTKASSANTASPSTSSTASTGVAHALTPGG